MLTDDLITPRLVLRSTREEWGQLCLDLWLDEENGRYLADPPRDRADEAELNFARGIEAQEGWYPFVAFSRETGACMGTCSVVPMEDGHLWDLGYVVRKDCWRQGYCTEMLRALMDWGMRSGAQAFSAKVAQENTASNAVMRKLGFRVVGESRFAKRGTDLVYPEYIYRLEADRQKGGT